MNKWILTAILLIGSLVAVAQDTTVSNLQKSPADDTSKNKVSNSTYIVFAGALVVIAAIIIARRKSSKSKETM